jgi:GH15 family glucan-1,4-alpha-glucosidase
MSLPIEDYGLISDCYSAALVGKNGSIDWLAFPRFDSSACFAGLLGDDSNGHWIIGPMGASSSSRKYRDGALVLDTLFETPSGQFRVTDCMPYGEKAPSLIRIVEGLSGEADVEMIWKPRFDYGGLVPWIQMEDEQTAIAIGGPDALLLRSEVHLERSDNCCHSRFRIKHGEKKTFVLSWYPSHKKIPDPLVSPNELVNATIKFWRDWKRHSTYKGFDEEGVSHSLMVLKALTYKPTGAIVAAPTTSLPEELGGGRNWDYRFSWIRDSSLALLALQEAGYMDEARDWKEWLLRAVAGEPDATNIMYGLRGERRLTEIELPWLSGYEGSCPVRIGNAAHAQFQLDVFGELLAASYIGRKKGIHNHRSWDIEREIVNYVTEKWTEKDEGIWEVRNVQRHFTHSKLMAWLALHYAVKNINDFGLPGDCEKWIRIRDRIHADICEKGFDPKLNSFIQYYGGHELDTSLLMMAKVGFLPASDPRIIGTVKAIQENLMEGGLVRRYRPESGIDGLGGDEGCFIPCTFWLVDNLRLMGKRQEAIELFNHVSSYRNDLGLFSEEYSVKKGRLVGNFPQGFSHIAHAVAAMGLEEKKNLEHQRGGIYGE